jgi:hypothetical protein
MGSQGVRTFTILIGCLKTKLILQGADRLGQDADLSIDYFNKYA